MHVNRCYLGCCTIPTSIPAVDVPTNGLKFWGQTVRKASVSEEHIRDEMESNGVQTQKSLSLMSTSTQTLDYRGAGSTSNSEFLNHVLLLWTQTRQQWIGNKKPETNVPQHQGPRPRKLSWNAMYENLLGTAKSLFRSLSHFLKWSISL